jgi:solute carrier family 25 protein 38
MEKKKKTADLKNSLISGIISGSITAFTFQPFEFVKTRLQQPETSRQNISKILKDVLFKENQLRLLNIRLFYAGLRPSFYRSIPTAGIYFTTLEYLKHSSDMFGEHSHFNQTHHFLNLLIIGSIARTAADLGTYPLNLIKTRFESNIYNYQSIWHAFTSIVRKDGWPGLFVGFGPTLIRDLAYSGVYFPLYTVIKEQVSAHDRRQRNGGGDDDKDSLDQKLYYFASCALVSSFLACALTQPVDVVRSFIQLKPHEFKRFFATTKFIYLQHGLSAFFAGFWPRSTRRILISVMSWTIYEKLSLKA